MGAVAFAEVFGTILLPVLSIVGFGYGVAHAGILADSRTIARIALFLCIPALAFTSMAKSHLSTTESFVLLASPWFLGGAMHLVGERLARLLHFERVTTSGFLLSIITANTGNFGIPVHQFAFGPEGLVRAALYFVGSTTFFFTVGVFTASTGSRSAAQSLKPIFRLPLLYAAAGLLVNFLAIELPVACARTAETLAGAAVPMMLLALGSELANARTAEEIWGMPVACAMGLKLIGAPLAAWLFTWLLGLDGLTRNVILVQAAMPAGVHAVLLAREFSAGPALVNRAVLMTTLTSVITLMVLLGLLR